MNLIDLTRDRREGEFKYMYESRYRMTEGIVKDTLALFFDLLCNKNSLSFSNSEDLENSINEFIERNPGRYDGFKFVMADKFKKNYSEFYKTMFVDFALRTAGGGSGFSDGKLSKLHFALVSPDYIDDDYDRSEYDLSSYIDYRIGLYGNLTKTEAPKENFEGVSKSSLLEKCSSISDLIYVSLIRMNIGLIRPNSSKPEALCLLNIDLSSDLFKNLSLDEMRTSTYRNEIFNVIFNKIFLSMYTNLVYFSIVSCYDRFRNVLLNNTSHITYFDVYMSLITNILSSNSVNCKYDIMSNNPELTLSTLLDGIRLSFLHRSSFNIIHEGIEDLRRFLVVRNHQYPIYLDYILDRFLAHFRNKANSVHLNKRGLPESVSTFGKIPKNFSLESAKDCKMRSNPLLINDNGLAIENFYGVENMNEEYFEKIRRKRRVELLGKLSHTERNKLLKLETEVARAKADIINCESMLLQKALLKRLNVVGKDINDIMSKSSNSDEFKELLIMLEGERRDLELMLSGRDFKRERKTLLYGQLKTAKDFDY